MLSSADEISQQLNAKLRISEEARVLPEQARVPEEDLTPLQQLLKLCDQQVLLFAEPARLSTSCNGRCFTGALVTHSCIPAVPKSFPSTL